MTDPVVLKPGIPASSLELAASGFEGNAISAKSDVAKAASRSGGLVRLSKGEERNARLACAEHHRNIRPGILVAPLEAQNLLVPPSRTVRVRHGNCYVIELVNNRHTHETSLRPTLRPV